MMMQSIAEPKSMMAQYWRGLGRLSGLSVLPRNWIAAKPKSLKVHNAEVYLRRTLASDSLGPNQFGGGKKALAELYAFDGMPPSSFTLVYKTDLGKYFVATQTILWLAITASGVTFLGSVYEYYSGKNDDEAKVKERAETVRRETEAQDLVRKGLVTDKSETDIKDDTDSIVVSKPGLADLFEKDLTSFSIFVLCLIGIVGACTKLTRTVPVRVYIGKKVIIIRRLFMSGIFPTRGRMPKTVFMIEFL